MLCFVTKCLTILVGSRTRQQDLEVLQIKRMKRRMISPTNQKHLVMWSKIFCRKFAVNWKIALTIHHSNDGIYRRLIDKSIVCIFSNNYRFPFPESHYIVDIQLNFMN